MTFDELFAEVTATGTGFGHREHLHLTWLAVTRLGPDRARVLVRDGILATATAAGVPEKFHATLTDAWFAVVAHHAEHDPAATFDDFMARTPALLDKDLLARFFSPETLSAGREQVMVPDRSPWPWA